MRPEQLNQPLPHITLGIQVDRDSEPNLSKCLQNCLEQDYENKDVVILMSRLVNWQIEQPSDQPRPEILKFQGYVTEEYQRSELLKIRPDSHLYGFLYATDLFCTPDTLSKIILNFINFPRTVGIVHTNYILDRDGITLPQIEIHNNHYYISKICLNSMQNQIPSFLSPTALPHIPFPFIMAHYNEYAFVKKIDKWNSNGRLSERENRKLNNKFLTNS